MALLVTNSAVVADVAAIVPAARVTTKETSSALEVADIRKAGALVGILVCHVAFI